jgi:flap endonuclease-1
MGIHNLSTLLKAECPDIYHDVNLSEFANKRFAVDASLFCYKYLCIAGYEGWMNLFVGMMCALKRNRICCVFVLDGKAPKEKELERADRQKSKKKIIDKVDLLKEIIDKVYEYATVEPEDLPNMDDLIDRAQDLCRNTKGLELLTIYDFGDLVEQVDPIQAIYDKISRQCVKLTPEHIGSLKRLLTYFGVPWLQAEGEAEALCSYLAVHKKVDAVLTEDTDVLAYGSPVFISKFNMGNDTCRVIYHKELLKKLKLKKKQFVEMCIMCGTDYNKNIPKIGPKTAYKLIRDHKNIKRIGKAGKDISILNHKKVKKLFKVPKELQIEVPYTSPFQKKELIQFLSARNSRYITSSSGRDELVKNVKDLWKPNENIVFED